MLYVTTIENNFEEEVEVTVNFDIGEHGVEINSIHDNAGNDIEPFEIETLESRVDEYFSDMMAEVPYNGRHSF